MGLSRSLPASVALAKAPGAPSQSGFCRQTGKPRSSARRQIIDALEVEIRA